MTILIILSYIATGTLAGIIGGLLGIGGGVIIVPALLFLFSFLDFPKESLMHIAIVTSLACTTINSFAASYFHNKKRHIDWVVIYKIIPGIVIGSILGSLIADDTSDALLQVLFGVFLLCIALQFIIFKQPKELKTTIYPTMLTFSGWGSLVSCLSNLLGIGGGVFMIPLLNLYHLQTRKIIGTSSFLSFCISLLGTLFFVYKAHISTPESPSYIYLPAFIIVGVSGTLSAFYGVKLAQTLSIPAIRKIFAISMFALGIYMIIR